MILLLCCCLLTAVVSHYENVAVLVDTSSFFFNSRHTSNVYTIYSALLETGWNPHNIHIFTAAQQELDPRNPRLGMLLDSRHRNLPFSSHPSPHIHNRGSLTPADLLAFISAGDYGTSSSSLFLFLTGHGSDDIIKHTDKDATGTHDLVRALKAARGSRWYRALVVLDTCRGAWMAEGAGRVPGVVGLSSSGPDESSYSLRHDQLSGVSMIDRFSAGLAAFIRKGRPSGPVSPSQLKNVSELSPATLRSHIWSSRDDVDVWDYLAPSS
eukprot:gnl/Dysnectes_brevis/5897_a8774_517.p1 GENE.gnl/Dysnectes_brevis/5897_a8774_517~~gnl/Dysnectes_brevis/5897_a8774_517.p1  ORF type:complete len:268 (+),score=35.28 gnl/Dysnectes_brevis/5897_a8774_517:96-899(+)